MSLTKLSLGGNNFIIHAPLPPRRSLVSDIPAGDGNIGQLFYGVGSSDRSFNNRLLSYPNIFIDYGLKKIIKPSISDHLRTSDNKLSNLIKILGLSKVYISY
jgi:hypothetical protein